jgi:hypothetical protein
MCIRTRSFPENRSELLLVQRIRFPDSRNNLKKFSLEAERPRIKHDSGFPNKKFNNEEFSS